MITFITGTPGAGKTLYAISKLLLQLVGTFVPQDVDGVTTMHPRTIYTNINGLLVDHELIDENNLANWHEWSKPGSVIVFDEVQRHWKPRPNGSKVPPEIEALETHRHMGVDLILISQHPMLVDRNVHQLVGRHLHVRRMANAALAIVYEWDHCSRTLAYKASLSKSFWRYRKADFKLYKSAELHTKQKRAVPGLVYIIGLALVIAVWKIPESYSRIIGKGDAVKLAQKQDKDRPNALLQGKASADPKTLPAAPGAVLPLSPASAPVQVLPPVLAGCARLRDLCRCYDQNAQILERPAEFCQAQTVVSVVPPAPGALEHVPELGELARVAPDLDMIAWASRRRR
ncbi:MAG: zonular occludens toxin domain-containing protein [Polaromonas sp.]|uniref:zonular occludens toxin domain-containing protein n=1 Tax=Polaromonas sp. TaxID=1869339 RepID=UPI00273634F2|nr:zonular occludens toxin domain-containing protein [Polaromonas sp.]MDP3798886.1 zonular occludens toxin domain-containing protein [Polaromonas sp.]